MIIRIMLNSKHQNYKRITDMWLNGIIATSRQNPCFCRDNEMRTWKEIGHMVHEEVMKGRAVADCNRKICPSTAECLNLL